MANLYWCNWADVDDWGALVVAETKNKAKAMFYREHSTGSGYIDVRAVLEERNTPHPVGLYDSDEEEWTREWYCRRELGECHCRRCRAESEE